MDWLDLLAAQGNLKNLQHHSSKALVLQNISQSGCVILHSHQILKLNSKKAAQTPASATGKWGQGREAREAQAAVLCKNRAGTPHTQPEGSNLG